MKILICPLNWGLGHATRCVPINRKLRAENHEVVIASDGFPLEFLQQQFPELRFITFPSYKIKYSLRKTQIFALLKSLPNILMGIWEEHCWLKKLLGAEHFDQVISDYRFGLWTKKTHCTYITHQLMIKMPRGFKWLEPLVWLIHRVFINMFNKCWIPDVAGKENLSADLSHKYPLPRNAKFIGPLSRFQGIEIIPNKEFEVIGLISGPEPQRTLFENFLIEKFKNERSKTLIMCGKPQSVIVERNVGNIKLVSHLPDKELAEFITGSGKIMARSGYSTIMDLVALNCLEKTEFVPTPGQTEQEYLKTIHNLRDYRI
ncbi:MAG: hypothetical protein Q7U47_00855 [Paludibacter sp.]|nr:hypothetical protein [Paludibacter sp.]